MPNIIFKWSVSLATIRLSLFFYIYFNQSTDAQWQLDYFPLWIIDFPISIIYFVASVPIPLAEGIIGPIWWFFLPLIFWKVMKWLKRVKSR